MYTLSEARYACSSQIGRKAKTLAGLYAKGFRVCEGMILNTDAVSYTHLAVLSTEDPARIPD